MTARERMAIDREEVLNAGTWVPRFMEVYQLPQTYYVELRRTRLQLVVMNVAMARERGWCVELFQGPVYEPALPPYPNDRVLTDRYDDTVGSRVMVGETNAELAQAFGEESAFGRRTLESLRGEWEYGTFVRDTRMAPGQVFRYEKPRFWDLEPVPGRIDLRRTRLTPVWIFYVPGEDGQVRSGVFDPIPQEDQDADVWELVPLLDDPRYTREGGW